VRERLDRDPALPRDGLLRLSSLFAEMPDRVVPVPATLAWMLEAQINLNDPDCQLLFPTPRGRPWRERTLYRDLWKPAQEASGSTRAATATSPTSELSVSTTPISPR